MMKNLYFLKPEINKKKIIILIIILLVILIISLLIFLNYKNKQNKKEISIQTFNIDNNFNIITNKTDKLKSYTPNNNFIFELHSDNNLDIYIDKLENTENFSLQLIAKADSDSYPKNFENVSNLSQTIKNTINGIDIYSYEFDYLDTITNTNNHLKICFLQINEFIYSINFKFPTEQLQIFNPIVNDIINSISL